jgi:hypothetical protein
MAKKEGILSVADIKQIEKAQLNLPKKMRPHTADGHGGALLDLRGIKKDVYILGDLHANLHNFTCACETDDMLKKVHNGEAILLSLGDLIHDDRTGHLTEMEPSLEMLEAFYVEMKKSPEHIFYMQGNHDTFNPLLVKSGIKQAEMFANYVIDQRGKKYYEALDEFMHNLPLFVIADSFVSTHAGPIRGGADYSHLVEIRRYESEAFQLMWNRINLIGSEPNRKEYAASDVKKQKEILELEDDHYFVVGHNPLHDRGGGDSIWFNIMGVQNHIILISSMPDKCPMIKFSAGKKQHELLYADLKLEKSKFFLGDIY